jgi:hypothetical protein
MCHATGASHSEDLMLKKLATLIVAGAFGLAVYSPSADACPGADKDETSIAKKDKKKKDSKKVADKKKAKDKNKDTEKKKAKKKDTEGKKVSRK